MLNSEDFVKVIKKAAIEAVKASKPADILLGNVQSTEPLINTVSRFILQLWYNAEQSESEKLQRTIDSLLKAITLKTIRS